MDLYSSDQGESLNIQTGTLTLRLIRFRVASLVSGRSRPSLHWAGGYRINTRQGQGRQVDQFNIQVELLSQNLPRRKLFRKSVILYSAGFGSYAHSKRLSTLANTSSVMSAAVLHSCIRFLALVSMVDHPPSYASHIPSRSLVFSLVGREATAKTAWCAIVARGPFTCKKTCETLKILARGVTVIIKQA